MMIINNNDDVTSFMMAYNDPYVDFFNKWQLTENDQNKPPPPPLQHHVVISTQLRQISPR